MGRLRAGHMNKEIIANAEWSHLKLLHGKGQL